MEALEILEKKFSEEAAGELMAYNEALESLKKEMGAYVRNIMDEYRVSEALDSLNELLEKAIIARDIIASKKEAFCKTHGL